jgi:hypothetical protein
VFEPKREAAANPRANEDAETVIALGRRVYRFCRQSPEVLALDPPTVWRVIHDSYSGDAEDAHLLAKFKDTSAWAMAVLTAKVMHEAYAAGGLDEEPA